MINEVDSEIPGSRGSSSSSSFSGKEDGDDIELANEGIQPPENQASDTSLSTDNDSLPKRDSSLATSRKLPNIPQEEDKAPQPDVVVGGGNSEAEIQKDDAGTYAPLWDFGGQQSPLIDPDRQIDGDGMGTVTRTPLRVEENREADEQTGEPPTHVRDRNAIYSFIDRDRKNKAIKLKQEQENK